MVEGEEETAIALPLVGTSKESLREFLLLQPLLASSVRFRVRVAADNDCDDSCRYVQSRIQHVLSVNRNGLAAGRVLLPRGDDRHYFLVRISSGLTPEQAASQGNYLYGKCSEKALVKDIATFDRQVASGRFDTAVLSHEALFRQSEPALSTLRDHLARQFSTIEVIIYLRDLASQRVSAINQAIKTGRIDLDEALARTGMARYADFLPRLEAVFGRPQLHMMLPRPGATTRAGATAATRAPPSTRSRK
jgi:hypothetical protein